MFRLPSAVYMNPKPLQLYDVEVPLGMTHYRRLFIIVRVEGSTVIGLPLSTKVSTFFKPTFDFLIRTFEAEFPATGLETDSFVVGTNEYDLQPHALKKYRGELTGDLAAKFLKWYGSYRSQNAFKRLSPS